MTAYEKACRAAAAEVLREKAKRWLPKYRLRQPDAVPEPSEEEITELVNGTGLFFNARYVAGHSRDCPAAKCKAQTSREITATRKTLGGTKEAALLTLRERADKIARARAKGTYRRCA